MRSESAGFEILAFEPQSAAQTYRTLVSVDRGQGRGRRAAEADLGASVAGSVGAAPPRRTLARRSRAASGRRRRGGPWPRRPSGSVGRGAAEADLGRVGRGRSVGAAPPRRTLAASAVGQRRARRRRGGPWRVGRGQRRARRRRGGPWSASVAVGSVGARRRRGGPWPRPRSGSVGAAPPRRTLPHRPSRGAWGRRRRGGPCRRPPSGAWARRRRAGPCRRRPRAASGRRRRGGPCPRRRSRAASGRRRRGGPCRVGRGQRRGGAAEADFARVGRRERGAAPPRRTLSHRPSGGWGGAAEADLGGVGRRRGSGAAAEADLGRVGRRPASGAAPPRRTLPASAVGERRARRRRGGPLSERRGYGRHWRLLATKLCMSRNHFYLGPQD